MSLQVGGARRNSPSVRHIAKCQNPHCQNVNLTRLVDYVKCNVCGWDTRMNAQDVIDRWGEDSAKVAAPVEPSPSATEEVLADMDAANGVQDAQESAPVSEAPDGQGSPAPEAKEEGSVRRGKKQRG